MKELMGIDGPEKIYDKNIQRVFTSKAISAEQIKERLETISGMGFPIYRVRDEKGNIVTPFGISLLTKRPGTIKRKADIIELFNK
jgi:hypothetical protein